MKCKWIKKLDLQIPQWSRYAEYSFFGSFGVLIVYETLCAIVASYKSNLSHFSEFQVSGKTTDCTYILKNPKFINMQLFLIAGGKHISVRKGFAVVGDSAGCDAPMSFFQ